MLPDFGPRFLVTNAKTSAVIICRRLSQVAILLQPVIDHPLFETPLISNFECWNFFLRDESVNGEFIYL
jgi:hypothetical protein